MLSEKLPVNSRLLVVKFWGSEKLYADSLQHLGWAPYQPHFSRVNCIWYLPQFSSLFENGEIIPYNS